ncbi:hypothetical protein Bca52824_034796 [Brassica carinata]|uniref:Uncharacterized protein n=1 Tax=Brassica carinata TaxID=52824 RepID=A0A8X7S0K2_BRACI|nr:hypothetical protein Bca52824_034796 [Brassica carinata]
MTMWSDGEEDEAVDNLVRLNGEGYDFRNKMLKRGLNSADLVQMRNYRKQKKKKSQRKKKDKDNVNETANIETSDPNNHKAIRELVATKLKDKVDDVATVLREDFKVMERRRDKAVDDLEKLAH